MEGFYDAMCLGNHEIDLGLEALLGILSGHIHDVLFKPLEVNGEIILRQNAQHSAMVNFSLQNPAT